jgi:GntR family transcriptional repressor for pyruvate dehydrogenase complex
MATRGIVMSETKLIRPEKAAESVQRHIEDLILEGSLRPGEALLPERELAARLDVSRPTVRDALRALEQRGLLARDGRSICVSQLGAASITDPLIRMLSEHREVADHYLEFRDIVESSAAGMAALRANTLDLQRIKDCAARILSAYSSNDPAEEAEADASLHIAIYEASHNLVILQIMRALSGNLRRDVLDNRQRLFTLPQVRDVLRDQHLAIAQSILDRDPGAAQAAAHSHLSYLRQATREVREAEIKLDLSLRRLGRGGLSAVREAAAD